jgi:hypothetical protein
MQQPFNECWRGSIDVGIDQTSGSDILLISLSVAESRFKDSVDDKNGVPPGIPAHDDAEIVSPISELATSRIRYCTELARLLKRDWHDLMEEQIFQNDYLTAKTFLNELTESLGLSETIDVKRQLFEWISRDGVFCMLDMADSPGIMCIIAGTDERWTEFATLVQRVVGTIPSDGEVERVISIQRDFIGTQGTGFNQEVFRNRTQLHQSEIVAARQYISFLSDIWIPIECCYSAG